MAPISVFGFASTVVEPVPFASRGLIVGFCAFACFVILAVGCACCKKSRTKTTKKAAKDETQEAAEEVKEEKSKSKRSGWWKRLTVRTQGKSLKGEQRKPALTKATKKGRPGASTTGLNPPPSVTDASKPSSDIGISTTKRADTRTPHYFEMGLSTRDLTTRKTMPVDHNKTMPSVTADFFPTTVAAEPVATQTDMLSAKTDASPEDVETTRSEPDGNILAESPYIKLYQSVAPTTVKGGPVYRSAAGTATAAPSMSGTYRSAAPTDKAPAADGRYVSLASTMGPRQIRNDSPYISLAALTVAPTATTTVAPTVRTKVTTATVAPTVRTKATTATVAPTVRTKVTSAASMATVAPTVLTAPPTAASRPNWTKMKGGKAMVGRRKSVDGTVKVVEKTIKAPLPRPRTDNYAERSRIV